MQGSETSDAGDVLSCSVAEWVFFPPLCHNERTWVCVRAYSKLESVWVQSHLVPEPEKLAQADAFSAMRVPALGSKFLPFSSNISAHQYLIIPGPNQKINS